MMVQHTVPDVAEKIERLFSSLKGTTSYEIMAKDINDILIYADKIPLSIIKSSWDFFAKTRGVENI